MKINENLYENLRLVQNSGKNSKTSTSINQNSRLSRKTRQTWGCHSCDIRLILKIFIHVTGKNFGSGSRESNGYEMVDYSVGHFLR